MAFFLYFCTAKNRQTNMKKLLIFIISAAFIATSWAQHKPRPDAFPPVEEDLGTKAVNMAYSPSQMSSWDRYPTYSTYVTMMQQWATDFPTLCRLDTIGTSVNGRLILSMELTANPADTTLPEFFYSSTIHGDEVTGYVMMLRLIDTLLRGYGNNPQYTALMNTTLICINPLANPDGTYNGGDNTLQGARRYNAYNVDLNRNYPNPFATAKDVLQQENQAMINYFNRHNFRLSANLHGGAEVMNYPWDSYTSLQNPHPKSDWWVAVCQRFVDTSRTYNSNHFNDTYNCGYTAGGDWYVITGGRQDYFNYYYNCRELTMEISTTKKLSSNQLPTYWDFLQHSFVNYIAEIHWIDKVVTALSSDTTHGTVDGGGIYDVGDVATLSAIPANNCRFVRWSNGSTDNPLLINVAGDTSLTAIFVLDYSVTALSDNSDMGYVDGSGTYPEDSTATLTAYAFDGYIFTHWMDGDTTNPRFVTVTSDTLFTAYFEYVGEPVNITSTETTDAVKIYVRNGCITVDNTQLPILIYDIMGRRVEPRNQRPGVYIVKVGNRPARKLVIMQ